MKDQIKESELKYYIGTGLEFKKQNHSEPDKKLPNQKLDSDFFNSIITGVFDHIGTCKPIVHKLSSYKIGDVHNTGIETEIFLLKRGGCEINAVSFRTIKWLTDHHYWIFNQSYFEKGLLIDKTKMI